MLNNYKKLPIELVDYILFYKQKHKCLVCFKNYYCFFYYDKFKINLCSFICFSRYFFFKYLKHTLLHLFLLSLIIFFPFYGLVFCFIYLLPYFLIFFLLLITNY